MKNQELKKILYFIFGIACDIIVPLLLVFIACPFFCIEGTISHGVLSDYFKPGNFICILLIPSLLIIAGSFFSYYLHTHKKDAHDVNPWLWFVFAIIVTVFDLVWLIVPAIVIGFPGYLYSHTYVWWCAFHILGFNLYCIWKGYSLSLNEEKKKKENQAATE